ncbi:MFS transporter [Dethiosulfatibacter aminovorans]|uniref:MFS transporter n=1 Tax=Dethiosulfatibacter aminovorans TaxID=332095 RepID=UPI00158779CE|nr:MFS transporter [Dethiosulfatibacter aminovorans]
MFLNALIGCTLSAGFPQSSMTIPFLSDRMNVSQELLLTADTVKTAGIVMAMFLSGFAYRKYGSVKTFLFSMLSAVVPLVVIPYVRYIPFLFMLKFIQGFSSIIYPVFLIIIMDWIPENRIGLSTAVFNGIFYGGAGIGATFAGFVISRFGWVESYFTLALVQVAVSSIWLLTVRERDGKMPANHVRNHHVPLTKLMAKPVVWLLALGFLSTTWSVQVISVDMPLFASYLGFDEMETGKIMSAATMGIFFACAVSGNISDIASRKSVSKLDSRTAVFSIGCLIVIISVAVILISNLNNFLVFYFAVLLFSFGAAWGLGSFYSILPEIFNEETLPVATGFIGGCGDIGMVSAPVIVGVLFGAKGLWSMAWGICALIGVLSFSACLMIIKLRKWR